MAGTQLTRREALAVTALSVIGRGFGQRKPDITLRIREMNAEIGPGHIVRTLAYNDSIPGPLLRMTEGSPVSVDVVNETRAPEMLHWHGFHIPPNVDGAHEEGTPMVQGNDHRIYTFTPGPVGTRWYHTHAMAGHNLKKGGYTGQFGMVVIEPKSNPARYDLEVPIVLHEWEPFFSSDMAMDVEYKLYSVNGKMLGAGEPIRVKPGQRVLFRVLNASATMQHRLSLSGHKFSVVALDGNTVATARTVSMLDLAPGERADCIVEMNSPGVWVFGELNDKQRAGGLGIAVEYANAKGKPRWTAPEASVWDYSIFGTAPNSGVVEATIPIVIEPRSDGNLWAINGKSYPNTDPLEAKKGVRNRLVFDNRSDMSHPVHLHRHTIELTKWKGKPMAGVFKDVVLVPAHGKVEAEFLADQPGPSLFHCHQQFHMDFGFMALLRY